MAEHRTFYGGEAPVLATTGEVGGDRHYQGAGLGEFGAWKCPACGKENTTQFEQGCPQCGAGAPGKHVGVPPPTKHVSEPPEIARPRLDDVLPTLLTKPVFTTGHNQLSMQLAEEWVGQHPQASLMDAFAAGFDACQQLERGRTMRLPPVTADLPELSPQGKGRRTIIAALKHFRDTILIESPEETTTGEWCTTEEASALIAELEEKA